jgi:hypothetical protein
LFFYLQNFYKRSVVVVEPFSLELLKNHVKSDNVLDCNEFPKTKFAPDEVLSHHHMTSHSHDISWVGPKWRADTVVQFDDVTCRHEL